jgi:hypothetical protein
MTTLMEQIAPPRYAQWDAFVAQHPLGRAFATSASRPLWAARGWNLMMVAAPASIEIRAGAAIAAKRMPYLPFQFGRIEALMPDPADVLGSSLALLRAAEKLARRHRIRHLEIPSWIPENTKLSNVDYQQPVMQALSQSGFVASSRRFATYLVDLRADDETLLGRITSKCRRDIRKGLREGIQVSRMQSRAELDEFCARQLEMSQRKNVFVDEAYSAETLAPLLEGGQMLLFAARHQGRTCNMALIDALGNPRYILGTTTPAAFEKGVPPSGQPLHYEIMRYLRDAGRSYYDLGGAPGPQPVEGHPGFTVWRFKHEFGAPYVYMLPIHSRSLGVTGRGIVWLARKTGKLPA